MPNKSFNTRALPTGTMLRSAWPVNSVLELAMESPHSALSKKLSEGATLEQGLLSLKERGFTPIEVIQAIQGCLSVTLSEAKATFAMSQAWRVENEAADQLHEEVIKEIKKIDDA